MSHAVTDTFPSTSTPILVLMTRPPTHSLAHKALQFCQAYAKQMYADNTLSTGLKIFFYGDAASIANRLRWQPADQINLTQDWQKFAHQHGMTLPVCVSTALARGVCDADNAKRHQLTGDSLAMGFKLVGLSELAILMDSHKVVTF